MKWYLTCKHGCLVFWGNIVIIIPFYGMKNIVFKKLYSILKYWPACMLINSWRRKIMEYEIHTGKCLAWLRSTWCFPYIYALCKHFYILTTLIILTNSNNFRLQKQTANLIFCFKNFDCVKFGKRMNHFFMYLSKVWHGEWSRARSLPINLTGM